MKVGILFSWIEKWEKWPMQTLKNSNNIKYNILHTRWTLINNVNCEYEQVIFVNYHQFIQGQSAYFPVGLLFLKTSTSKFSWIVR